MHLCFGVILFPIKSALVDLGVQRSAIHFTLVEMLHSTISFLLTRKFCKGKSTRSVCVADHGDLCVNDVESLVAREMELVNKTNDDATGMIKHDV